MDDCAYDNASWYRRHRGDPPLELASGEKKPARANSEYSKEAIWDVEYTECGGDDAATDVFGSLFE